MHMLPAGFQPPLGVFPARTAYTVSTYDRRNEHDLWAAAYERLAIWPATIWAATDELCQHDQCSGLAVIRARRACLGDARIRRDVPGPARHRRHGDLHADERLLHALPAGYGRHGHVDPRHRRDRSGHISGHARDEDVHHGRPRVLLRVCGADGRHAEHHLPGLRSASHSW